MILFQLDLVSLPDQAAQHVNIRLHQPIFTSFIFQQYIKILKSINRNSVNVIYLISCKQCKQQYVGETCGKLKNLFTEHLRNIRKVNDNP